MGASLWGHDPFPPGDQCCDALAFSCSEPLSTSAPPSCRPVVMSAVPDFLSARSFPLTPAWPGQEPQQSAADGRAWLRASQGSPSQALRCADGSARLSTVNWRRFEDLDLRRLAFLLQGLYRSQMFAWFGKHLVYTSCYGRCPHRTSQVEIIIMRVVFYCASIGLIYHVNFLLLSAFISVFVKLCCSLAACLCLFVTVCLWLCLCLSLFL